MKKIYITTSLLILYALLHSQSLFIVSSTGNLYKCDANNCEYTLMAELDRTFTDIAFHPNGNLYGAVGQTLYEIDTLSGDVATIHYIDGASPLNSLVIADNGLMYSTGMSGELWSYSLLTGLDFYHGEMMYNPSGDLIFVNGDLYVAAGGSMVLVDINNPENSSLIFYHYQGFMYGLASTSESCYYSNYYAFSAGDSRIYQIDFVNNSFEYICQMDIEVYGAANSFAPSPIVIENITLSQPSCNLNNGTIEIEASGGSGPISYSLDAINFQESGLFTDLYEDDYTLYIIEGGENCYVSTDLELLSPPLPQISTLMTHDATCENNNGSIEVLSEGGVGLIRYSLDGINYQSNNVFNNLPVGSYTAFIKDSIDCIETENTDIITAGNPAFSLTQSNPTTCNLDNGMIIAEGVGGAPPYHYSINGNSFQSSGLFENLETGNYNIIIRDSLSCMDSIEIHIEQVEAVIISEISSTPTSCGKKDGKIQIAASDGTEVQYSIDGTNFGTNNLFENLDAGVYPVFIRDQNDCVSSTVVRVSDCPIFVPNVFTPNGDGNNDSFNIYPHPDFNGRIQSISIFDRWGALIYSVQNFDPANDNWDGTHKGKILDSGVYVYFIELEYEDGERTNITGDITLLH